VNQNDIRHEPRMTVPELDRIIARARLSPFEAGLMAARQRIAIVTDEPTQALPTPYSSREVAHAQAPLEG
jgi:hypothetical protein